MASVPCALRSCASWLLPSCPAYRYPLSVSSSIPENRGPPHAAFTNGRITVIQLVSLGVPEEASFRLSVYSSPSVIPVTRPGSAGVGCGMTPGGRFSEPGACSPVGFDDCGGRAPASWAAAVPSQPERTMDDNTTGTDAARIPDSFQRSGKG